MSPFREMSALSARVLRVSCRAQHRVGTWPHVVEGINKSIQLEERKQRTFFILIFFEIGC